MLQRFLSPEVLAGISGLDLVAKTVVDGFIAGLHHNSPDFRLARNSRSTRFYTPGDDLRHVDWNVFARTERMYLKRYRGETNCQVTILLDSSRSMKYGSHSTTKLEYGQFLAASLAYLAHLQRDAAGLIVFDEDVRNCIPPPLRLKDSWPAFCMESEISNLVFARISRGRSRTCRSFSIVGDW